MRSAAFLVLAGIAITINARAQVPAAVRPVEPDVSSPVWGGIAFGGMGFLAGALVGRGVAGSCHSDFCGLGEAFLGAAAGGTFGMALGVHVGNRSRGNLGLDVLTGAGVWLGGMAIGTATKWKGSAALLVLAGIPIVQMVATVNVERNTGRERDRADEVGPSISILPTPHGATLSIRVPLPPIR